mgnify:CR=1 FL=1
MVSSLLQIVVGFSGVIGFLLRFVGPLTITPTITLVGLTLFPVAASHSGNNTRRFLSSHAVKGKGVG